MMNERFITDADVARLLNVCERTVQRQSEAGLLPGRIRLSRKCVRWDLQTLDAYLRARASAGDLQIPENEQLG